VEFDELFVGAKALTWDDVQMQARIAGVTKEELLGFIKTTAGKLDASEKLADEECGSPSPSLQLVQGDMVATNGTR